MVSISKGYASTLLGQIHYRRLGEGSPIVLLPHSGRSSRMFANLARELARRHDVVAFDLPGSGESAPLRAGASFQDIATALMEAIGSLGLGPVGLYGIHTGNKLGAIMAADPAGPVGKFVLAGQTHSLIPDQTTRNEAIRVAAAAALAASHPESLGAVIEWTARVGEFYAQCLSRATLNAVAATSDLSAPLDWLVDEAQGTLGRRILYDANFRYDLEADLRRIAVPTLILEIATPAEDRRLGRQGAAVQKLVSGAWLETLVEPDGVGFTMEHRAGEIAALVSAFFNA
jgi:pimeloyl-ACP methyl ester carboxylesterase